MQIQPLSSISRVNRVVLLSSKRKVNKAGGVVVSNHANFNIAGKDYSRIVSVDNTVTFEKKTYSLQSGLTLCKVEH